MKALKILKAAELPNRQAESPMFKSEQPMIKQGVKPMTQTTESKEQTGTSAQQVTHITKVKPRPDFVVLGPGNGCRPAGTT